MKAVATVSAKIKQIATNKGHLRLFAIASIIWVAIAGPVFWKPLPYFDDSVSMGDSPHDNAADDATYQIVQNCKLDPTKEFSKYGDPIYDACRNRINAQVQGETKQARFLQIIRWSSIVLLVPVILPVLLSLLALIGATIFQWTSDGYRKN
jgi:hypothetical protein